MREIDIKKYEEVLDIAVNTLESKLKERGLDDLELNRIETTTMKSYNFIGSGEVYLEVATSREPENTELLAAVNKEIEYFLDFYLDVIIKIPNVKHIVKRYVLLRRLKTTIDYYFKDILAYKFIDTNTKIFTADNIPTKDIKYDFKTLEFKVAIIKPKKDDSLSGEFEEVVIFDLSKMMLRTL